MPEVSIGLPIYNGQRYLAEVLASLLGQTFGDLELIISDNASTDATEAICRCFAARDPRIRYIRNPINIGAVPNYNRTFRLATGTYFHWACDDDICAPTYLEKCVAVLDRDPSIVLCQSRTRLIDEDGADLIYDPQSRKYTDRKGMVCIEPPDPIYAQSNDPLMRFQEALVAIIVCQHVFGLIRVDAMRRTGLLGPYYEADRAFLVEMTLHGRFHEVPEELFFKREHPRNSRSLLTKEARERWANSALLGLGSQFTKVLEYRQILGAVLRSPLSRQDKAKCIGFGFRKVCARLTSQSANTSA